MKPVTKRVTAEQFVREWQRADNFPAFCEATGAWPSSARTRATQFRKMGVPLKKFPVGRKSKVDVKALVALARSLAPRKAA